MTNFDLSTLINWLASGFIGFIFGIAGTWVTYRYERKRDDIAWEREKEKIKNQFEHEKLLLELQYQQKMKDAGQSNNQQHNIEVRKELLQGVDNPGRAIQELQKSQAIMRFPNDSSVYKMESPIFRRLRWWASTPKEMRVVITLSFIFTALFFLTLILSLTFIYMNQ